MQNYCPDLDLIKRHFWHTQTHTQQNDNIRNVALGRFNKVLFCFLFNLFISFLFFEKKKTKTNYMFPFPVYAVSVNQYHKLDDRRVGYLWIMLYVTRRWHQSLTTNPLPPLPPLNGSLINDRDPWRSWRILESWQSKFWRIAQELERIRPKRLTSLWLSMFRNSWSISKDYTRCSANWVEILVK